MRLPLSDGARGDPVKPRLRYLRYGRIWTCSTVHAIGVGSSRPEAFRNWQANPATGLLGVIARLAHA